MTQTDPGGSRLVERAREAERRGDTARSLGLYDDAIEALEREQDLVVLADALRWKGTLHREQGDTEAAYRCYTQSLIQAEKSGSISRLAVECGTASFRIDFWSQLKLQPINFSRTCTILLRQQFQALKASSLAEILTLTKIRTSHQRPSD